MMGSGRGSNVAGGNPPSSTSNLSASAPPFTVDRSNSNYNAKDYNSNPLSHYPESTYGTEPLSHAWMYANSSSHKPQLDMHPMRTTSFPFSDDYRLPDAISTSSSPTHRMACSRGAKTLENTLAYGGGVKSFYPPSVPPMVDKSSTLVEDGSAYTLSVIDQDYRPEWMNRLDCERFISGQQSKELDGSFSAGKEKMGDMSAQIDYTRCVIDQDYIPQQMDSLDINGIRYRRVNGSCSLHMENAGDTTSQFDYTQSAYDWKYRPQQTNNLNIKENLYKRAELNRNLRSERAEIGGSYINTNHLSEGCGIEVRGESGDIYGRSIPVNGSTVQNLTVDCVNDNLCFEENPSFLISGSTYAESQPLSLSHEMHKDFFNYNNSCSPYEKRVRPDDSAVTGSISVRRSSPTVVIMPPPSRKPAENDSVAGVCNVHFDHFNPSNNKDPGPEPSSEIKEGALDPKIYKLCTDRGFLSSSVANKFSSSLHNNDTVGGNIKERFGSQTSDSNFYHGLVMADGVQVVNSIEDSLDFMDHQNLAVDSPCWKGAPSSQFSEFDVEAGFSHDFIGKLDEKFDFDEAKHKDFRSLNDPTGGFPARVGQNDENDADIFVNNNVVHPLDSILRANSSRKERILQDGAKAENFMVSTLTSGKGVQTGDDAIEMRRINFDLPENLNCGSHAENSDLKHFSCKDEVRMNPNYDPESSDAVAFHVGEKLFASPSSQEDATEHAEQQPDPKIQTMIKTMHYLSEMLLFHLSYDARALEEENILALNHTISNLSACMSTNIARPINNQEPCSPKGYISKKFGGYRDMGTDYKHGHAQDGERTEKSPVFPSSRDDITRDDGMAKAIQKVLDENFHYNEEMDSQASLFKSLWLKAEATLCSISYKARFDRLKTEMEQAKMKSSKENKDVAATMQKVHISAAPSISSKPTLNSQDTRIPIPTTKTQHSSVSITVIDAGKNDSIMSRFNILKSREDNLKSTDMRNEQRSKTIIGDQLEGEALNMLNEEHNPSSSVTGYGYEPGHLRSKHPYR